MMHTRRFVLAALAAGAGWLTMPAAQAAPFPADGADRSLEAASLVRPGNPVDGERRVGATPKSLGPNTGMLLMRSGSAGPASAGSGPSTATRTTKTSKGPSAKSSTISAIRGGASARPAKPAKPARAAKPAKPARIARPMAGLASPASVGTSGSVGLVSRGSSGRGPLKALGVSIPGVSKASRGKGGGGDDD